MPQQFPNVAKATASSARKNLDERFVRSLQECRERGDLEIAELFVEATQRSCAVFNWDVLKLFRQIATGMDIFENYYQMEELRLEGSKSRHPEYDWNSLRVLAELGIAGSIAPPIFYACLSLGGISLDRYGDCKVVLSEVMTAHRSSCLEGNSAVICRQRGNLDNCLWSDWDNRGKLAFTVYSGCLTGEVSPESFSRILVQSGSTGIEDKFIEVHVYGTLTIRSIREVHFPSRPKNPRECVYIDAMTEKLTQANVRYCTHG